MTDEIQAIEALQDNEPLKPHRSQWGEVWLQFRQHKGAMVGGAEFGGGNVEVNADDMTVSIDGEVTKVDACNVIPAMKACFTCRFVPTGTVDFVTI
ncbi:MAG: hypothetical protein ACPG4J_09335, partial [Lentibacter algarum]